MKPIRLVFHRPLTLLDRWREPARAGLSVAGAIVVILLFLNPDAHGVDARGYWAFEPSHPYREAIGNLNAATAFRYAPPIAQILAPLHALPWAWFITFWTAICLAALVYLAGRWALALAVFYPVAIELSAGNVNLLIAAAVVAGFERPATWSFVLLTKLSPGVGLLWFGVRREWRELTFAVGATAAVAVFSFLTAPDLWAQWIAALQSMAGIEPEGWHIPLALPYRVAIAAVLIMWGARTHRRWTVLVGAMLALPTIFPAGLSMLCGLIRLQRGRRWAVQANDPDRGTQVGAGA
jgi:hypothetical protein